MNLAEYVAANSRIGSADTKGHPIDAIRNVDKWLIVDMNYALNWKFYSGGNREPRKTLLCVFDFLQEIRVKFEAGSTALCFDQKPYKRTELYASYKAGRGDYSDRDGLTGLVPQFQTWLRKCGYRNVLMHKGYEADDVMAAVAKSLAPTSRGVVITEDRDLYQVVSPTVSVFHPNKDELREYASWEQAFGIVPSTWATVKAIAGCSADNVLGLYGVGEETALRYVRQSGRGPLKKKAEIRDFMLTPNFERNLKLVTLPWPGLPPLTLLRDPEPDPDARTRFMDLLFRS